MHHRQRQDNSVGPRGGLLLAAMLALSAAAPLAIADSPMAIAGVEVARDSVAVGRRLALNGAGVRSRFTVRVYVGALYLERAGLTDAAAVLEAPGVKRVSMFILRDALSRETIVEAWNDGFAANTPAPQRDALAQSIERFNALWPALHKGDRIDVDLVPGHGVSVSINGAPAGGVDDDALARAVLRIWLGDEPADSDLKRAMLGGSG